MPSSETDGPNFFGDRPLFNENEEWIIGGGGEYPPCCCPQLEFENLAESDCETVTTTHTLELAPDCPQSANLEILSWAILKITHSASNCGRGYSYGGGPLICKGVGGELDTCHPIPKEIMPEGVFELEYETLKWAGEDDCNQSLPSSFGGPLECLPNIVQTPIGGTDFAEFPICHDICEVRVALGRACLDASSSLSLESYLAEIGQALCYYDVHFDCPPPGPGQAGECFRGSRRNVSVEAIMSCAVDPVLNCCFCTTTDKPDPEADNCCEPCEDDDGITISVLQFFETTGIRPAGCPTRTDMGCDFGQAIYWTLEVEACAVSPTGCEKKDGIASLRIAFEGIASALPGLPPEGINPCEDPPSNPCTALGPKPEPSTPYCGSTNYSHSSIGEDCAKALAVWGTCLGYQNNVYVIATSNAGCLKVLKIEGFNGD